MGESSHYLAMPGPVPFVFGEDRGGRHCMCCRQWWAAALRLLVLAQHFPDVPAGHTRFGLLRCGEASAVARLNPHAVQKLLVGFNMMTVLVACRCCYNCKERCVGFCVVWMMLMDCTPFVLQYSGDAPCWCSTWHACSLKLLLAVQYWACSQAQLQDVGCLPGCCVLHHTHTKLWSI